MFNTTIIIIIIYSEISTLFACPHGCSTLKTRIIYANKVKCYAKLVHYCFAREMPSTKIMIIIMRIILIISNSGYTNEIPYASERVSIVWNIPLVDERSDARCMWHISTCATHMNAACIMRPKRMLSDDCDSDADGEFVATGDHQLKKIYIHTHKYKSFLGISIVYSSLQHLSQWLCSHLPSMHIIIIYRCIAIIYIYIYEI